MRRFRVNVQRTETISLWVEVEAEDQAGADEAALEWVYDEANEEEVLEREHLVQGDWEVYKAFRCVDCGYDTAETQYPYSVSDETWAEAGMTPNGGMLCVACLERRLGRDLGPQDVGRAVPGPYGQAPDPSRDYERGQEFTRWVMAHRADSGVNR